MIQQTHEADEFTRRLHEVLRQETATSSRLTIPKRTNVYNCGDRDERVYFIESGQIKLQMLSPDGRECLLAIYGAGDIFGELCLSGRSARRETATAMEQAVIKPIPRAQFFARLGREGLLEGFVSYLASRISDQQQIIANLVTANSEQRLGKTLLQLAMTRGGSDPRRICIHLRISHDELAAMVGTTRPRISYFMNRFHQLGLIETSPERFLIIRTQRLADYLDQMEPRNERRDDAVTAARSAPARPSFRELVRITAVAVLTTAMAPVLAAQTVSSQGAPRSLAEVAEMTRSRAASPPPAATPPAANQPATAPSSQIWLSIESPGAATGANAASPPAATPKVTSPPAPATGVTGEIATLTATLGSGLVLTWPQAADRIAIADETLARLNVVSPREVVVTGLRPGRTTILTWFPGGKRLYRLVVEHNLQPARAALFNLDPRLVLESGADPDSIVLRGEVDNEATARQARSLVEQLLPRGSSEKREPLRVVNLVRYEGSVGTPEDRLTAVMAAIDPRITVRRIQSGADPVPSKDSYILEGRVRDVNALIQAVILADRQLGGTSKTVKAADAARVAFVRSSGANAGLGGGGGGGGGGGLQGLQGGEPPQSGIAAQLARGLLLTSESGQVVSFLQVDALPQIMVAIRVLEIDRSKARRMGVDFRLDANRFSVGNFSIPGGASLPDLRGKGSALAGAGNLVASFVNPTVALAAALDLLTQKQAARSVAEPNVLTLSGEQATVLVGGEVPIPITSTNQVATQAGFFFQQFGVRLDIRPTLDRQGMVTLEVAPSIVTPSPALGNTSVPGFRIQRVETTARVRAGESLVLGGLLTSNESIQERGVPGLNKIPLFRWEQRTTEDTELLFLITPRVIEPPSVDVALPPLDFREPPNRSGASGLDADGVPISFKTGKVTVGGNEGTCVELHVRPNAGSPVTDCGLAGTSAMAVATDGPWTQIQLPTGNGGWVPSDRLLSGHRDQR